MLPGIFTTLRLLCNPEFSEVSRQSYDRAENFGLQTELSIATADRVD
jgi:hypothetical protein